MLENSAIKAIWNTSNFNKAFYAEHRLGDKYNVHFHESYTRGLCSFRSELTLKFENEDAIIVGQGWGETEKRQKMADWHFDKLIALRYQSRIVSVLEYVTEKIFDAFAVLAVPVYFANDKHDVNKLADQGSYIYLYNSLIGDSASIINGFQMSDRFISSCKGQQTLLATIFANYGALYEERNRVVGQIYNEFLKIQP
jgi:hypothetical protein